MTMDRERPNGHERFTELCALAMSGTLTAEESSQLKDHLRGCPECREAYREYLVLTHEGMPHLASRYSSPGEEEGWDDTAARRNLHARVTAAQLFALSSEPAPRVIPAPHVSAPRRTACHLYAAAAVAACVVVAVCAGAYRYGRDIEAAAKREVASATASADGRVRELTSEKKAVDNLLRTQTEKFTQLQAEGSRKQKDIETLHSELETLQQRATSLAASKISSDEQLRSMSQQRDALSTQLEDARHAYDAVQGELVSLRAERDKATLQLASLEMRVDDLSATNRAQERKLEDTSQFLSSDRDIRELMGARNLYIADVFDVDSSSRTRKPFGRIFYTRGKSLIFYAFDLDRQPGVKNAGAFQAWGQKDTPQGESPEPVNLGILYMDNQANRRWALHCDDPQQLAEIDAVFVTVEPSGGSEKPTGKPFLYAMLRKEANHP